MTTDGGLLEYREKVDRFNVCKRGTHYYLYDNKYTKTYKPRGKDCLRFKSPKAAQKEADRKNKKECKK